MNARPSPLPLQSFPCPPLKRTVPQNLRGTHDHARGSFSSRIFARRSYLTISSTHPPSLSPPNFFSQRTFMPARKCPQPPKPRATAKFSRCHARSRLRAAGGDGWTPWARQGREHDPRRGRRSVLVAGPPAMGVQVLCTPRRAGPPRRVFPTSASTSLQTRQLARQGAHGGRTRSRTKRCAPALHRPPTSQPSTSNFCGPPSSGYATRLRRSATCKAAPSTSAVHGWGCPVLVKGDTRVASQQRAPP